MILLKRSVLIVCVRVCHKLIYDVRMKTVQYNKPKTLITVVFDSTLSFQSTLFMHLFCVIFQNVPCDSRVDSRTRGVAIETRLVS